MTTALEKLKIKIFADGADLEVIADLARNPLIQGFTTNPTLMRKAGLTDYGQFAREALQIIGNAPISFEVFSDDFEEMEDQAREIASWGRNVYAKIPVTNTQGRFAGELIRNLAQDAVRLNITALMTLEQVNRVLDCLSPETPSYISVFAGRIADTGVDPVPLMKDALRVMRKNPSAELIWASPRELLNIFHAEALGCHVITVTQDILGKLPLVGKDLAEYSLDTVKMFHRDAQTAGFKIDPKNRGKANLQRG